jgi:hypothetical protein
MAPPPGAGTQRSPIIASRFANTNEPAELSHSVNAGDVHEPLRTLEAINRMAASKAPSFLASIESAQSAPARLSTDFSRRPAVQEAAATDGECWASLANISAEGPVAKSAAASGRTAESDALDVSFVSSSPHAPKSIRAEHPCDGSTAAVACSDSATFSARAPSPSASGVAVRRSKAALPLSRYMRVSDDTGAGSSSRDDDAGKIGCSSHVQLGSHGQALFDCAAEAKAQVIHTQVLQNYARVSAHAKKRHRLLYTTRSRKRASLLLPVTGAPLSASHTFTIRQPQSNRHRHLVRRLRRHRPLPTQQFKSRHKRCCLRTRIVRCLPV